MTSRRDGPRKLGNMLRRITLSIMKDLFFCRVEAHLLLPQVHTQNRQNPPVMKAAPPLLLCLRNPSRQLLTKQKDYATNSTRLCLRLNLRCRLALSLLLPLFPLVTSHRSGDPRTRLV